MFMSKRVRGSVSLMLCLVLLPLVTYSTMIIDASRLQAVRSNIAGAGELTLNAIMSDYNYLLEDMYGLFANCKSEEDLRPALKAYFQQTVESRFLPEKGKQGMYVQNLTEEGVNHMVDMIWNSNGQITDDMLTDFLKLQLDAAESDFSAAPIEGSALANPFAMKRQITEYMKYRGPVSIASTLLGKIDFLAGTQEQVDACQKKVDYAKKLGDLQDPCLAAYEIIENEYNMGALTMNNFLDHSFSGLFGSPSSSDHALEQVLTESMWEYDLASQFYILNANSPFTNGYSYQTVKNAAGSVEDYNFTTELAEEDNIDQKIQKYRNTLDAILNTAANECGYQSRNNKNKIVHANTNNLKVEIKIDQGIEARSTTAFNRYISNSEDVSYITASPSALDYNEINSDKEAHREGWYRPYFQNACGNDADRAAHLSHAETVYLAQKKLVAQEDDIKSMIIRQQKLAKLSAAFNANWNILADLLREKYEADNRADLDEINNAPSDDPEAEGYMSDSDKDYARYELWNDFCDNSISWVDHYESNAWGLSVMQESIAVYYLPSVQSLFNVAIDSNKCYLNFANEHNERGCSGIIALGKTLDLMKSGLKTARDKLNYINSLISGEDGLEAKAESWKGSIDSVDSDSTKASMLSDYETTVNQFSKEEVDKLINVIGATDSQGLIKQVSDELDYLSGIKFCGEKLYNPDDYANNTSLKSKIRVRLQEKLSGVPADANNKVWNKIEPYGARFKIPQVADKDEFKDKTLDTSSTTALGRSLMGESWQLVYSMDNTKYEPKLDLSSSNRTQDERNKIADTMKKFIILDGVDDEKASGQSIHTNGNVTNSSDLLSEDEAFMITLYTEWKAAQNAPDEDDPESMNNEDCQTVDQLESEALTTTAPLEDEAANTTATTVSLASEDIPAISSEIDKYITVEEGNVPTASVSTDVKVRKGKNAGKSNPGNALSSCTNFLGELGTLAEKLVENVYMEEYFTEMFTCRTDNQRLNPLTDPADYGKLPVIMLNGYGNAASHSGKHLNENTEWYGKEIEYILWGNNDLDTNLVYTDGLIFAIRFALNAVYAFTAQDIQVFAKSLATAIAGWTVVGVPIVAACITLLIALAESAYDIVLLHDGQNVPIYKTKKTFMCSPTGLAARLGTKLATEAINRAIEGVSNKVEEKLNSAVDSVASKIQTNADLKLSECADEFNGALEEFQNETKETIKTAIQNQFITPIMNQLAPLGSILGITEHYQTVDKNQLISDAMDKALSASISSILNMKPGVIKEICLGMTGATSLQIDNKDIGGILQNPEMIAMKETLTDPVTSYLDSMDLETNMPTVDLNAILQDLLDDLLDPMKDKIETAAEDVKNKVSDKIHSATDTAAASAKSEISSFMDEATSSLTGQVTLTMDNLTSEKRGKLAVDGLDKDVDTGTSGGGVTLNYKEYCKIFMLLFVTVNQDKMLQRAGVMMTANVRHAVTGAQSDFTLTNANTMFSVNAEMKMATLFPWPVKDVMNDTSESTGIQLDLSNIRGSLMTVDYCGVNGY